MAHQVLCLTGFNFELESIVGYVDMLFHPLTTDLKQVYINCQQCLIHRLSINDEFEPTYTYDDPTINICQNQPNSQNLESFESCHSKAVSYVDADEGGGGEICIKLPPELNNSILELKPFRVIIEFSLVKPDGGIKFVVPDLDGTLLDRGAHLFSFGLENSSRLWFPCIDSYSEVCTWKLEFTVSMYMIAVSCGELVDTVYTPDLKKKTYHYYLATPTAAPNIALSIGPFEVWVDPNMHEVTNFCLPHLLPILKHTTSFLHEVFEFYEELLSTRYPYTCYKQVFIDMAYDDVSPYATMAICSTNLLHSKRIIDQTPISQRLLAEAVAKQFFGCFISMHTWCDAWLTKGLASLLAGLYNVKVFGNNEYIYSVVKDMTEVCQFECQQSPVVLDPSMLVADLWESSKQPQTISPAYLRIYEMKSRLVMRMLEKYVGRELMLQVMNKILALATSASQQKYSLNIWNNMVVSTNSFLKSISTVTGKDVQAFLNQWVFQGGSVQFLGNFTFNRKRNVVELELKQDFSASKNLLKYAGPITVSIQELDGTFNHQFMVEENKSKFEIPCHSKSRRQKKKKIPLCTGEEVEMNLDDTDVDSPVLWVRVDPDMLLLRIIRFEQPDFMWHYMLRHEKCVVAQHNAITALEEYPTSKTRNVLTYAIENEKFFYRVKQDAAYCLVKVANEMNNTSWIGPPAMLSIFRQMFGAPSCPNIVRRNNFNNFQNYFLQKTIPSAMSQLRNVHNVCPSEVLQFLLDLLKYNNNSRNKYSDCYYRASLIESLSNTVSPAITRVSVTGSGPSTDFLTNDTRLILEEITRALNMEKLLPSYKLTVTVSCLKALRRLQKFGHMPVDSCPFKSYAVEGNFIDVRLAAVESLVDYTTYEADYSLLNWIIELIESDPDHYLRFRTISMMIECPPFTSTDSPLNTESVREKLWTLLNCRLSHDCRLRCAALDLYKTLYYKPKNSTMISRDKRKATTLRLPHSSSAVPASTHPIEGVPCNSSSINDNNLRGGWLEKASLKRRSRSPTNSGIKTVSSSLLNNDYIGSGSENKKFKHFHYDSSSDNHECQEYQKSMQEKNAYDFPLHHTAKLQHVNSLWSSIYPACTAESNSTDKQDVHDESHIPGDGMFKKSKSGNHLVRNMPYLATMQLKTKHPIRDLANDGGLDLSESSSAASSGRSSPIFKPHLPSANKPVDNGANGPQTCHLPKKTTQNRDVSKFVVKAETVLHAASMKLSVLRGNDDEDDDEDEDRIHNLTSSDSETDI
ncbi:hypothetical protein HELRODRAFT_191453 [Helobdella robusta]|uniref:Transcription initiation factor TFIID subunit 2 n=1 Tax=Helobdella robusta TaxID=6412 RepID=T1FT01_HELRO|nr:hypothetical protein HELRODRAFT_191453 [Helobdella robusta]ESO05362.1 hypothetical protein HELRODRAFT_191453 [Helobdella robusta]